MPRTDAIHNAVKNALIRDGWTITDDPYTIEYEGEQVFADLAAERPIAAERAGRKIVVEIKSFTGRSPMRDFEQALGQYLVYKRWLALTDAERKLYLAVSELVYDRLFSRQAIRVIVESEGLNLLVVNLQSEEVVRWTS